MTVWLLGLLAVVLSGGAGFAWARNRYHSRYLSDIKSIRGELSALQHLTLSLSETLALDDIVGAIAEFAHASVEADGVLVALAADDSVSIQIAAADGSLAALVGTEITREDAGLLGDVLKENRVAVAYDEADHHLELIAGIRPKVAAVAPLETHGTVRGVLAAVRDGPEPFTSDDIRQLVTVATQTSMALAHASLVEMMKRGKEQWEDTFDALTTGIAVVDGTCVISRANKALAELLERPVNEAVGLKLSEALPGDSQQLAEYIEAVMNGEEPQPLAQHSMDPKKRVRVSASRMKGATIPSAVVLVEDITERKLIEEQLIQSEKMAAVGQLVSGVAHDLNNPITSIAGVADLLISRGTSSSTDLEHLDMIREQAERASHIVRNLLTFARKDSVDTSYADLNEIVTRSAALINHEMKLREVNFECELAESRPKVRGDRHELQQVVLNLLTNAIQAVAGNAAGLPRQVKLCTKSRDDQVMIEVSDTGPGIDAKLLPQIFLPFVTTKPAGEGTGLGLSIAFRIVHSHNGQIEAKPRPGGGTVMLVTLPAGTPPEPRATVPSHDPVIHAMPELTEPGGKLSILVLDEDPAVQRSLKMSFSKDGHSVDATRDASQAFSLIEKNAYDLIVADARAVNADGVAFGDGLRSVRPDLCSRTILMTADVRHETDEWLKSLGFVYLRKPFDPGELRATARGLLAKLNP
jgi:two-component system NtrC family sensor kinase